MLYNWNMHEHQKKTLDEKYSVKSGDRLYDFIKSMKSLGHAWRGIIVYLKTTNNLRFHIGVGIIVILFGIFYHISTTEWLFLVLSIGFVLVAECFNTAIEFDIDLTSPEYHPYAKYTKDVAAGAVLLASITSVIIGLIIFIPKIFFRS